ncbi:MAG: SCP2 sterol-binding domain-containing protein [Caulobacter sp.]|nr:SCP2 sterol-binding domain-containing protein [Caulobacter sp.]
MRAKGIPRARPGAGARAGDGFLAGAMMVARPPVELALTAALRRAARVRPEVFDRLGRFRDAAFLIAPSDLPVAFRLTPRAAGGRVTVVRRGDPEPCAARISGPLVELLGLFDGSLDADAAFFGRRIDVDGDTGAVVALHNALEAADMSLAELLGLPRFGRRLADLGLDAMLRAARRARPAEG